MHTLVDAEFEVLRFFGVGVYRTRTLDGQDPQWSPSWSALLIGTDLTADEAEVVACELLGRLDYARG